MEGQVATDALHLGQKMVCSVMLFIPSNGSNGSDVRENQKSWWAWVGASVNNGDVGSS